jgi:nitrogen fixation protein NifB
MTSTVTALEEAERLALQHPCYTETAADRHGRIHVPVAPRCNLGCAFCQRSVGAHSAAVGGPGAAARILSPEEAFRRADDVAARGWLRVAGVAGPGEPLANEETFETLRLLHASHPELLLCLSTNGLELEQRLPDLLAAGLSALTITINTTSVETASRLYRWARLDGRRLLGKTAAREILRRQWRGLAAAARAGLLIKVNSVFIPEINADGLSAVARRAAALGAHRQNIMPLIPRARLRDARPPTSAEVVALQGTCSRWLQQFRGCTQCRADAIVPPRQGKGGLRCAAGCANATTLTLTT